jgi:hypothetical protein
MTKPARAITFRSVSLGMIGVVALCALTPFNNLIINNTDLIGNHFPAGVLLFLLIVVVGINAPLSRFKPGAALGRDELLGMLSMWLIASAIPFVGLNRYFPGQLSAVWVHAANNPTYASVLDRTDLPTWLFPDMEQAEAAKRGREPVNTGYFQRLPGERESFIQRVAMVPWSKWLTPLTTWGVFIFALFGIGLFSTFLWFRQWTHVERLPFPLASVYLSLVDTPRPGNWLSDELRQPRLWVAAGAVFFVHFFNGSTIYIYGPVDPLNIPLKFNIARVFSDTPLRFMDWTVFYQRVFFTIIGLMFFVRSNIAFSLWFFYLLANAARVFQGVRSAEVSSGMIADQILGAATVLSFWVLLVSRKHLSNVIRSFWRGVRNADERFERVCAVALAACMITMIVWLTLAGASVVGALFITLAMTLVYLVLARVIAETGLLYVLLPVETHRLPLYTLPVDAVQGGGLRTTLPTYFFSSLFDGMFLHDSRQAMPGFATTASKLANDADPDSTDQPTIFRRRVSWLALLALTVLVGYVLSTASTLYVRYNYDTTMDSMSRMVDTGNNWGSLDMPRALGLSWLNDYAPPRNGPIESHSRLGYLAAGGAITAVLGFMRFRFAAWPLDPVGYLLCWTWGIGQIWFSIFLGWLVKQMTLWLGGSAAIKSMRGVFIGLIIGETLGVLLWLIVGFVLALMGMDYYSVQILPS